MSKEMLFNQITERLNQHTAELTDKLKAVFKASIAPDVEMLFFEVFDNWPELAGMLFFCDADNNEVFCDDVSISPYSGSVELFQFDYCQMPDDDDLCDEMAESLGEHQLELEQMACQWLRTCWLAAGGNLLPYRCVALVHDGEGELDMNDNQWVSY